MSSSAPLIATLMASRFMRSDDEIAAFVNAVGELDEKRDPSDLPALFRVFDDGMDGPDLATWTLLHHVERYEDVRYAETYVAELPNTVPIARDWMTTLLIRQLNADAYRPLLMKAANAAAPEARAALEELLGEIGEDRKRPAGERARQALAALTRDIRER